MTAFQNIPIDDIVVDIGDRRPRLSKVTSLAFRMEEDGQERSIGVRFIDGRPHLVFGLHRLAAAESLGWDTIRCQVITADDRQAQLAALADNIHNGWLNRLERSEAISAWPKIVADGVALTGNAGDIKGAALRLRISSRDALLAQRIASMPVEAKLAAQALDLDNDEAVLLAAAQAVRPLAVIEAFATCLTERFMQSPERQRCRQRRATITHDKEVMAAIREDCERFIWEMFLDERSEEAARLRIKYIGDDELQPMMQEMEERIIEEPDRIEHWWGNEPELVEMMHKWRADVCRLEGHQLDGLRRDRFGHKISAPQTTA